MTRHPGSTLESVVRGGVGAMALLVCFMVAGSCHSAVTEGRAASFLVIDRLEASSGAAPTIFDGVLASDVLTFGGVFEDDGRVTMRLALKNALAATAPSSNNWITVTRYLVQYRRGDGRNAPGLDVPHPFDGAVTFTVFETDKTVTATFNLVRVQAKLEPPLRALRTLGGAVAISSIADVIFYGRDQTGTDVSETASIGVNFADWADPVPTAARAVRGDD